MTTLDQDFLKVIASCIEGVYPRYEDALLINADTETVATATTTTLTFQNTAVRKAFVNHFYVDQLPDSTYEWVIKNTIYKGNEIDLVACKPFEFDQGESFTLAIINASANNQDYDYFINGWVKAFMEQKTLR